MIKEGLFYLDAHLNIHSFYMMPTSLKHAAVCFEYYKVDNSTSIIKSVDCYEYPRTKWVNIRPHILTNLKIYQPLTKQEFETKFHYEPNTRITGR